MIAAETVANSCNVWTQKLTRFSVKWLDQSTSKHWAASNLSVCFGVVEKCLLVIGGERLNPLLIFL